MPGVIDAETMQVDRLPGVWSPVQWDLTEEERAREIEEQAKASLLWAADVPEAVLRLLLSETGIERVFGPPEGYDPEQQGEWDSGMVTFGFSRRIHLQGLERKADLLEVEYQMEGAGWWRLEIGPERVVIERV
jgi:hypothetical protein